MAELALKIGAGANYEDGDILCAFNSRRIRCTHAQHICHVKDAGLTHDGLRPNDSLARMMQERVSRYRFERISVNEIKRITLATMKEEILSDKPNAKGECIHVEEYIDRRLDHPRHRIFGALGKEIWYGGRTDYSNDKMTDVWREIESRTSLRELDHLYFPIPQESGPTAIVLSINQDTRQMLLDRGDKPPFEVQYFSADREYRVGFEGETVMAILGGEAARIHLFIHTDDFDDAMAEELVSPLHSEEKAIQRDEKTGEETVVPINGLDDPKIEELGLELIELKKRSRQIAWRDLPGLSVETMMDIPDPTARVDICKDAEFVNASIVQAKTNQ